MYYVTMFEADPTKSFTQTAFNNIKSLQTQSINFELRPLSLILNWSNRPSWFTDTDRDYFTRTTPSRSPAALVHLQISDLLKVPYSSKTDAVGMTAIETSHIPRWICEGLNESYRGLIVPSEFNKSVLISSGLKIPVRVVPHALPRMWHQSYPKPATAPKSTYVFGFVGNWNSRKNPLTILESYLSAFPEPPEGVALMLKTFNAGDVESYIKAVTNQDRPDIWVYDESWSESQMLWGFQMIDCYVSPHRGEGFGLSLAQTAALGKPCIYTDYSAPTEWLGEGHFKLPYTIVDIDTHLTDSDMKFDRLKGPGIEWAHVEPEILTREMKRVADLKPVCGFSKEDLAAFRDMVTWESVGASLVDALEDILDRPLERIDADKLS